jgi:hypothetical protein
MNIARAIEQALYSPKNDRPRTASTHEANDAKAAPRRGPPPCEACGASPRYIVRGRKVAVTKNNVFHLAEIWVCNTCGADWADEVLARLNEWAAEAAALEGD